MPLKSRPKEREEICHLQSWRKAWQCQKQHVKVLGQERAHYVLIISSVHRLHRPFLPDQLSSLLACWLVTIRMVASGFVTSQLSPRLAQPVAQDPDFDCDFLQIPDLGQLFSACALSEGSFSRKGSVREVATSFSRMLKSGNHLNLQEQEKSQVAQKILI